MVILLFFNHLAIDLSFQRMQESPCYADEIPACAGMTK